MHGLVSHPTFHVLTTIGVCMVACFHAAAASCQLRVGTFNIRCVNKNVRPAALLRKHYDDAMFVSRTKPKGPWRSFTGWGKRDKELPAAAALKMRPGERDKVGGNRIDYIYVSRGVYVLSYETFAQKRKGTDEYFSDHQPVVADITVR